MSQRTPLCPLAPYSLFLLKDLLFCFALSLKKVLLKNSMATIQSGHCLLWMPENLISSPSTHAEGQV